MVKAEEDAAEFIEDTLDEEEFDKLEEFEELLELEGVGRLNAEEIITWDFCSRLLLLFGGDDVPFKEYVEEVEPEDEDFG